MSLIGIILFIIVRVYTLLLIARLIIEMVASFSRSFQPPRWFSMIAEPIFQVTNPPVKALRRVIPPLRTGQVAIDLSVIVLFFILAILGQIILAVMVG